MQIRKLSQRFSKEQFFSYFKRYWTIKSFGLFNNKGDRWLGEEKTSWKIANEDDADTNLI